MMMTVKQYADDRQSSETTVKRHITKLGLTLPLNPNNRKQRLLSLEHQRLLDASIGYTAPTVEAEILEPVPQYQRSEAVGMIIAEAEILRAQHLVPYQNPEENPLLQALKAQVATLEQANLARYQQIEQDNKARQDAQQAIAAAKRLKLMQDAQQEAFEAHQLKKQLIAQATTELELFEMGLGQPTPTAQPVPQSQPAASPSPDWL